MNKILIVLLFTISSCASKKTSTLGLSAPLKNNDYFQVSWIKDLDPEHDSGNLPIGTSSPYAFDDILYMGGLDAYMKAYNVETGQVIWSTKESGPIQSPVNKYEDYVFYGTQSGRLYVRHYLTGKLKYSVELGTPIEGRANFVKGRLILHLKNHTVISLDALSGKVFWRYKRTIPYITTLQRVSEVLSYKENLIVGFADGYLVSLSLAEGVVKWEQKLSVGVKFVDVDAKPILFKQSIVAGSANGPMRFLNPDNGAIEKTIDIVQGHTPLVDENELIVGSVHGVLYRVDQNGKVLLRKKVSERGISSIRSWKKSLAVTTMGRFIYEVDKKTLAPVSEFNLGTSQSAVFGNSILSNNYLSVYSSRNRLYVFR